MQRTTLLLLLANETPGLHRSDGDGGDICHLRVSVWRKRPPRNASLSVGALIVAVTPVAACGLPLPALVGAGGDIAGGGCCNPNAIAPVTPMTVAIDVVTVDAYVPIDIDVAIDVPVDTHVSIDADVAVNAPIEVRTAMHVSIDVRISVNVRAAMDTGMTLAPSVSRYSKYHRQERDGAQSVMVFCVFGLRCPVQGECPPQGAKL